MTVMPTDIATEAIVVDEVLPHSVSVVWKALTNGALVGRWLMPPNGFAPVVGTDFTFQTTAGGAWDGVIHCRVLEVEPPVRLSYSWRGGHPDNSGYGASLDTLVTWLLSAVEGGARLRLVHSGFVMPRNETAYRKMSVGWQKVVKTLGDIAGD